MNTKQILKIGVDILMTAALLLLMAYELVGQAAHEWIGGTFSLFFADYFAAMGLFVCVGHYLAAGIRWLSGRKRNCL